MNEEKRLDDKALEGVSGGTDLLQELNLFSRHNCMNCRLRITGCPYGGVSKALKALGVDAICPEKEEWQP